jgi:hypothetical protein
LLGLGEENNYKIVTIRCHQLNDTTVTNISQCSKIIRSLGEWYGMLEPIEKRNEDMKLEIKIGEKKVWKLPTSFAHKIQFN